MNLFLAFIIFMLSIPSLSFSETLDRSKFMAPGSQQSNLRAPANTATAKSPGPADPTQGPSASGERRPIAPTNGTCPFNYHCRPMNNGASFQCFPNDGNRSISGPELCSNVIRYCNNFKNALARGATDLNDSDRATYAYYCT